MRTTGGGSIRTVTSLGAVILPNPFTYWTLFFLNRYSMPPVSPVTAFSLLFIIWPKSKLASLTAGFQLIRVEKRRERLLLHFMTTKKKSCSITNKVSIQTNDSVFVKVVLGFFVLVRSVQQSLMRWRIKSAINHNWVQQIQYRGTFEGMQPTLRQVPPKVPLFSTQATFNPCCPALIAATYPPGPPPTTTRSSSSWDRISKDWN